MRRMMLWCAGAAAGLALSAIAGASDLVLTGNVPATTYTNFDGDIYIYKANIVVGPGGSRTLTLRAHNGRIIVGSSPSKPELVGINGKGADGGAGANGGTGYNVVLETTAVTLGGVNARDIEIHRAVDCRGGNGGNGVNGAHGYYECDYFGATPATDGGAGGHGGNITITGVGPITVSDSLNAGGGAGGLGGYGGNGIAGPGFAGGDGGDGGASGTIMISNANAPSGSLVSLYTGGTYVGSVLAEGGLGGDGGAGGLGDPAMAGGDGGHGGAGGPITIKAKTFTMGAATGSCAVSSAGASGGMGGDGGDGRMSGCVSNNCPPPNDAQVGIDGSPGGDGGAGGSGGDAASITITSNGQASLGLLCGLNATGGDGAIAGRAGVGGLEQFGGCTPSLCTVWQLLPQGVTPESGDGGNGAAISVTCVSFALTYDAPTGRHATIKTSGGNGEVGVKGSPPANYCCGMEQHAGPGAPGGAGGSGGNGGLINIKYATYSAPGPGHFAYCGGLGRAGGNGSEGFPVGAGGPGGVCGTSGSLTLNNIAQFNPCTGCSAPDGADGVNNYPPCIQP